MPLPRLPVYLAMMAALALPAATHAAEKPDLREFVLGTPVADLPATGYMTFTCINDPSAKIEGWGGYATCPVDAHGLHAIGFQFEELTSERARMNENLQGTKVGGHPAVVVALIGKDAKLDGLRIETDPNVRLYMHKKAFLLGLQARERYGETGWTCNHVEPAGTHQPIGDLFVEEHCDKMTPTRHYEYDRELFRNPADEAGKFTSGTQLSILLPGVPG